MQEKITDYYTLYNGLSKTARFLLENPMHVKVMFLVLVALLVVIGLVMVILDHQTKIKVETEIVILLGFAVLLVLTFGYTIHNANLQQETDTLIKEAKAEVQESVFSEYLSKNPTEHTEILSLQLGIKKDHYNKVVLMPMLFNGKEKESYIYVMYSNDYPANVLVPFDFSAYEKLGAEFMPVSYPLLYGDEQERISSQLLGETETGQEENVTLKDVKYILNIKMD